MWARAKAYEELVILLQNADERVRDLTDRIKRSDEPTTTPPNA